MPLVSVIIPAYNSEKTLSRAIGSALEQNSIPLEIIVVDDGSTDGTADKVREYGGKVRLIQQENRGAGAARNRGVAEAAGEFIAFLDADDEYLPDRLCKGLEPLLANEKVGMTHCQCILHYPDGNEEISGERFLRMQIFRPERMLNPLYQSTPSATLRKTVFLELGGFDENLKTREDHDLWLRVRERYEEVYVDEPLVRVHLSNSSLSARQGLESKARDLQEITERALKRQPQYYAPEKDTILANLHWHIGLLMLRSGKRQKARQHFIDAHNNRRHGKLRLLICATFIPVFLLDFIRRIREK